MLSDHSIWGHFQKRGLSLPSSKTRKQEETGNIDNEPAQDYKHREAK